MASNVTDKITKGVKAVFNSKYFLLGITLLALLLVFVPLGVAPPDDDPSHVTSVASGKSMVVKVKSARLAVVILATLFVFIPLGIKSFMDIRKGGESFASSIGSDGDD